jgi:tetratricopeptide (TPR) repeat protein
MNKDNLASSALLALLILFVSPSVARSANDVDKATGFISAGNYLQAIGLLNKRISEDPTDAQAHFQLGICFVNTGDDRKADEHFRLATKLDSDYGHHIGEEYKKVATVALSEERTGKALILFRKAATYEPSLKAEIAELCFVTGISYLDQQRGNESVGLFHMAVEYDSSLYEEKERITREYGKKLLSIAKEKPKKERRKYVNEALKYITQEDVDAVLPPPTWRTVFEKVYFGRGIKGDKPVPTVKFTEQILLGDKIVITEGTGEGFYVAVGNKWIEHRNRYEVINRYSGSEARYLYIQAKRGVNLRLQIQRYHSSY